jgi:tRNA-Thr(GGU) m(6)t(6)A37 methyltransferase TsaA
LDGLSDFSHVWLVFVFHANNDSEDVGTHTKAKIRPPRLLGKKLGMFATRTPHRVNPIGLTVCRLDRIEGSTIHLSGVDVIDGTPILDVKPYHSADAVTPADLRVPEWINDVTQQVWFSVLISLD